MSKWTNQLFQTVQDFVQFLQQDWNVTSPKRMKKKKNSANRVVVVETRDLENNITEPQAWSRVSQLKVVECREFGGTSRGKRELGIRGMRVNFGPSEALGPSFLREIHPQWGKVCGPHLFNGISMGLRLTDKGREQLRRSGMACTEREYTLYTVDCGGPTTL